MILTITGLESHPTGTTGLNGIINGNWERLEEIFGDLGTVLDGGLTWNSGSQKLAYRATFATITYAGSIALNFATAPTQWVTATGDMTITTSNIAAGRVTSLLITATALCNLTLPGGWVWIGGSAPASIASGKSGLLELFPTGTTDAAVKARWTVQP